MFKYILPLLCLLATASTLSAQLKTPDSSPAAKISQTIGMTDIEISYARPSRHDRSIFGEDGLVPYGKQWRTGANRATTFEFSTDVYLQDQLVPKGKYTLITIPSPSDWQIDFFPYETSNWTKYREKEPMLSLTVPSKQSSAMTETFEINIENVTMEGGNINLKWENTVVTFSLKVEVHDLVLKSIEKVMAGPSVFDYYRAAYYLHKTNTDLPRALTYIQKATGSETQRFFFYRTESLIYAELGRYEEAIASAKKSIELSRVAKNDDFVRLNEKSIREWKLGEN